MTDDIEIKPSTLTSRACELASLVVDLENERGKPEAHPYDLVARRIILRRDRWEKVAAIAGKLAAERGIVVSPSEIAAILIDSGIEVAMSAPGAKKTKRKKSHPDESPIIGRLRQRTTSARVNFDIAFSSFQEAMREPTGGAFTHAASTLAIASARLEEATHALLTAEGK